jgi:uncharacterized membrane-anchored protein YhcB (DUF1043 family)
MFNWFKKKTLEDHRKEYHESIEQLEGKYKKLREVMNRLKSKLSLIDKENDIILVESYIDELYGHFNKRKELMDKIEHYSMLAEKLSEECGDLEKKSIDTENLITIEIMRLKEDLINYKG